MHGGSSDATVSLAAPLSDRVIAAPRGRALQMNAGARCEEARGADVLLLNTSFAGPALAEVVAREEVDAVIYDEEFTPTVDRALAGKITKKKTNSSQPHFLRSDTLERAHIANLIGRIPVCATSRFLPRPPV